MLSNYSEAPIELKPRPSAWLAWILAGFHVLVAITVLITIPFKPAAAALVLLTTLSWFRSHQLHIRHEGRRAVRRLVWQVDGRWLLEDTRRQMHPAELQPSSYLHPRLVLLNFRLEDTGRRRNVLLLPDSLDPECLRRLRARLRVEAAAAQKASFNRA